MRLVYLLRLLPFACLFFFSTANAQLIFTKAGSGNPRDYNLATSAYLTDPADVAVDANGNLFIADANGCRVRKVDAITGIITTVAGNGLRTFSGDGGLAAAASINTPSGLAIDGSGNLLIADAGNNRVRKVNTLTGIITTVGGNGVYAFSGDGGPAIFASMQSPKSISLDRDGNIYFSEINGSRVRKITVATGIISTVAGNGTFGFSGDGGSATAASFISPEGVAIDTSGNIYIADFGNHRIRKVDALTGIISTICGTGNINQNIGDGGLATAASLIYPSDITLDKAGNLYIADQGHKTIRKINSSTGIITSVAGEYQAKYSYPGQNQVFYSLVNPLGITIDDKGKLYMADPQIRAVRVTKVDSFGLLPVAAGYNAAPNLDDGKKGSLAWFDSPFSSVQDAAGNLYIADANDNRIRKVAPDGTITTIAGNGIGWDYGDFGLAKAAELHSPRGLAFDPAGDLLVADTYNYRIRKISLSTGIITPVAGNGTNGFSGDGGPAKDATMFMPESVAVAANGDIYIGDNSALRIRKVDASTGIITTIAGNGNRGYSGDGGPATAASLSAASGVAVDANNNVLFGDFRNHRIRKVSSIDGTITTIAGTGANGYAGDGGLAVNATFSFPIKVLLDASGNIYIIDNGNNCVRKIDASTGIISTVVGNGTYGFSGDGGLATSASLANPRDISFDKDGNLLIADFENHRIRYVCLSGSPAHSTTYDVRALYADQSPAAFGSNCTVQAKLQPSGTSPVTGTIADSVWIEPTVPIYNGQPYVQRHYGITPSQNASTATATLTLYYTQAEFTAYNAVPNHGPNLPVDAADAMGNKANIRIQKRPGTSNNGTGLFDTYSGNTVGIVPTSVVWNTSLNAWAVTFDVTGFSGFFLNTAAIVLPVQLTSLSAKLSGNDGLINWQTASEEATTVFELQRSSDGSNFVRVGTVPAAGHSSLPQRYNYTEKGIALLRVPVVYYRVKTIDNDGRSIYSKTVAVNISSPSAVVTLYPNPVRETATVQIAALRNETLRCTIVDAGGRTVVVKSLNVTPGSNTLSFDTQDLSSGTYTLLLRGGQTTAELKLVKQ